MTNAPTPAGMAELGDAVAALASITGLAKAAMDAGVKALAAQPSAAPVREEGGAVKLGESDLFEVADIIRTARGVKHVGSKDYAVADEIVCFVNNHPRNSAAALATREEAPAEVGEDAAWTWLNGHVECDPADRDYSADEMVDAFMAGQSSALRAQPQARSGEGQ